MGTDDISADLTARLSDAGLAPVPVDFSADGGRTAALMTGNGAMVLAYEDAAAAADDREFLIEAVRDGILESTPFDLPDDELHALAEQLLVTSADGRVVARLPLGMDGETLGRHASAETEALLRCLAEPVPPCRPTA